jgi:hypothetical protein
MDRKLAAYIFCTAAATGSARTVLGVMAVTERDSLRSLLKPKVCLDTLARKNATSFLDPKQGRKNGRSLD